MKVAFLIGGYFMLAAMGVGVYVCAQYSHAVTTRDLNDQWPPSKSESDSIQSTAMWTATAVATLVTLFALRMATGWLKKQRASFIVMLFSAFGGIFLGWYFVFLAYPVLFVIR